MAKVLHHVSIFAVTFVKKCIRINLNKLRFSVVILKMTCDIISYILPPPLPLLKAVASSAGREFSLQKKHRSSHSKEIAALFISVFTE